MNMNRIVSGMLMIFGIIIFGCYVWWAGFFGEEPVMSGWWGGGIWVFSVIVFLCGFLTFFDKSLD